MRDIKLKKWNTRKLAVAGVAGVMVLAAAGLTAPKYGLVNRWEKESAVEDAVEVVEEKYLNTVDSLTGELAEKKAVLEGTISTFEETIDRHSEELKTIDGKHREEKKRLAEEYGRRAGMAGRDSLDSFFAQHPGFDKNRDYISSIGYWGSRPSNGARDFGDYEVLKRSLEAILGNHKGFVNDVLEGRAILMSGEMAKQKTKDPSVRDGEKYLFVADEKGNPKGYGMDFDQYKKYKGGGK